MGSRVELQRGQPRIDAALGHQLRMGPLLDQFAVVEHHDQIGFLDGR